MANTMNTTNTIAEGDFKSLKISDWDREMLEDAYQAVTKANRWAFLKRADVPGSKGFMFSDWPEVKDIDAFMEYGGHSGASYGMTMRVMEFIAKHGWDGYVRSVQEQRKKEEEDKRKREERERKEEKEYLRIHNNFFRTANVENHPIYQAQNPTDPLVFARALQADPVARQMIPDIDEQAEAMKKFSEGKLSYAEMRSLCG